MEMREINTHPPQVPTIRSTPGYITKTFTIEAITPVFGGGHQAGEPGEDEHNLVRGTSVRGNLRFWWRATCGAACEDANQLRKAEGAIWGTVKEPGQVQIYTEVEHDGFSREPCGYTEKKFQFRTDYPQYALFPFQPNEKNDQIKNCLTSLIFRLSLTYPEEIGPDVMTALVAWVNFGGLGARTRRGCGALFCKELAPDSRDGFESWYKSQFSRYIPPSPTTRLWPTLAKTILLDKKESEPINVWDAGISMLKDLRQKPSVGRNNGNGQRPGRSRWPEPESIRNVTGGWKGKHQRMNNIPLESFPRAAFGLPIIFQFPGGGPDPTQLYPVLNGKKKTRMSSPLIIRPLKFQNGKTVLMICLLHTIPVTEVELDGVKNSDKPLRFTKITDPTLAQYPDSPMGPRKNPRSPSGSALEAFIEYAKEKGMNEVKI